MDIKMKNRKLTVVLGLVGINLLAESAGAHGNILLATDDQKEILLEKKENNDFFVKLYNSEKNSDEDGVNGACGNGGCSTNASCR
jgi:hypothetical protein